MKMNSKYNNRSEKIMADEKNNNFLIIENPMGMQFKIYYDNIHADCLDAVIKTMMSAKLSAELNINIVCKLTDEVMKASKANSSLKNRHVLCFSSSPDNELKEHLASKFKCPPYEECASSAGDSVVYISNNGKDDEGIAIDDVEKLLQHPHIMIFHNTEDVKKYIDGDVDKLSLFDLIVIVPCQGELSQNEKYFLGFITRFIPQEKVFILCTNKEQCVENISDFCQEILLKDASDWLSQHVTDDFDILDHFAAREAVFDCFNYTYKRDNTTVISQIYKNNLQMMLYYASNWKNILNSEMPQYIQAIGRIRPMFEIDIWNSLVKTQTVAVDYPHGIRDKNTNSVKQWILDNNHCKNGILNSVSGLSERMIQMYTDSKAHSNTPGGLVWNEFKNGSGYSKITDYNQLNFTARHGFLLRLIYSYLSEFQHSHSNSTAFDSYFLLTVIHSIMEFLSWLSRDVFSKSPLLIKSN